ncbi:MAG TPA: hypothetical protein VK176_03800, partial [Phycisphaerales bacterium]|nr:hypothetical protein [Phycisphaerales bacterium]
MCTASWSKAANLLAAFTAGVPTLWAMAIPTTGSVSVAMSWQPAAEEPPPPTHPSSGQMPEADAPRPAPSSEPPTQDNPTPTSPAPAPGPEVAPPGPRAPNEGVAGEGAGGTVPANPADQREVRVVTTSGGVFVGLLVEQNAERIILRINNIPTPFAAKDISKIETLLTNRERYEQYRAALDPKDTRGRRSLAQWLVSVDMFPEALEQLNEILRLDSNDAKAAEMRLVVQGLMDLRSKKPSEAPVRTTVEQKEPKAKPAQFPVLSAEDINMIRVYEVNLSDPPRMSVARNVVTRLLEEYAGDPLVPVSREGRDALYRRRPEEILELMFKLRARNLYGEVKIQQDPSSMRMFREQIHRGWLLNYCATTDCHGGTEAGNFWLNTRAPNTDATVYTNFYIMEKTRVRATRGEKRDEMVPLINYANPAQSPLLQLALPPENSLFPHPTPNRPGKSPFRPLFRDDSDPRFRKTVDWIASMFLPRPDYRIDYIPPRPPAPAIAQQPGTEGDPRDPGAPPLVH